MQNSTKNKDNICRRKVKWRDENRKSCYHNYFDLFSHLEILHTKIARPGFDYWGGVEDLKEKV